MHRTGRLFYSLPLLATLALCAPVAQAVPVTALYVVIVPGTDLAQAAQDAMRVELVRLIGTRDAASDPALAALIDNARAYVQRERPTTTGEVQVLFDEAALSGAIGAAGRTLWDADRPLLWIELPALDVNAAAAVRMRLAAAAEERGLPITIVNADAAAAAPIPANASPAGGSAAVAPATAGAAAVGAASAAAAAAAPGSSLAPQLALEAARTAGASAALVASPSPSQPGVLQWTLISADTSGQWIGGPELALDDATDALAGAARTLAQAPVAQYECHIDGVDDLTSLVKVLAVVDAAPGVTQVAVSEVQGDQLVLQLQARGGEPQLQRALQSERLQTAGAGAQGQLLYRYTAEGAVPGAVAPASAAPVGAAAPSAAASGAAAR